MKILRCFLILSLAVLSYNCNSQNNIDDDKAIAMLREFYTAYSKADFTSEKIKTTDSLQELYCSLKLKNEAREWLKEGHDLLTDDLGIIPESIKSLSITKDNLAMNTYVVSYYTLNSDAFNNQIKQKVVLRIEVVKEGEKYKISNLK